MDEIAYQKAWVQQNHWEAAQLGPVCFVISDALRTGMDQIRMIRIVYQPSGAAAEWVSGARYRLVVVAHSSWVR